MRCETDKRHGLISSTDYGMRDRDVGVICSLRRDISYDFAQWAKCVWEETQVKISKDAEIRR